MNGEDFISAQNYKQLFTQAPAPIAIYKGQELRYVFANDAYLKIFNYRSLLGKTLREAFPELEGQGYYEIIEQVFTSGEPYHANETPAYIKLGTETELQLRYYNLVYTPYKDEEDRIIGVMAFGHDVTDQVDARRKNAENEQRFRNVVEQAPDPILILKGADMILDVANQALLDLWQVTREAIGKPFLEILPEMKGQGFIELLQDVYHNGKTHHGFEMPAVFRRASGVEETVYFNFVYQPYREKEGTISGVLVLATNVTGQVAVRRQMEESEARLRIALDAAAMGTWEYKPAANTVFCSPRTNELFGFDGSRTITLEDILETISEEDRGAVVEAFESALIPGSSGHYEMDYVLINRLDGLPRNIRTQGKVLHEAEGTHRFIGTVVDISEEVRAREEQSKLLTLIDNSDHLMSILKLDGKNAYLNKAGMDLLGFGSRQEVMETPISELHTPEDIAFVESTVVPSILNEGRWSGSMLVRHLKTGEVFPVYNNSIRIDDPKTGKPLAIGAVMRDLRPERAAQQAIVDSERNFRTLVMQAPVGICIIKGMDPIIETVNEAFLKIIGKEQNGIEGTQLWEALPEVRYQGFDSLLHHVFTTGIPFYGKEYEVRLIRQGQEELIYVDFVYEPLADYNGVITRIMVLAIEVTDKVLARKKIEYAEERARLAIESAELGAYEVNMITGEMETTDRFNTIFGFRRTVPREEFAALIHKEDLPIREAAHRDSLLTGNLFYEARVIWNDQSVHWIRVKGGILFDEHKNPLKLIGVVQDITEQKQFAEQLERQVRERTAELERKNGELEQYAHVTSHDLQEPLRKIRVFADMIRTADYDRLSESSRLRFNKIEDAVARMSSFLRDLLNFTMLNREEQLEQVNLNQIVEAVVTDLELVIAQKKAVIHLEPLPVVSAIRIQMQQLFYNLVNNALKFSRPEVTPVIHITSGTITEEDRAQVRYLDTDLDYCRIVISDNGIGFDPDSADKIFGMFQRLHSRMEYSGTGIGLALCKKVVLNHKGAIYALSEPDKGTSFVILLPAGPTGSVT